MKRIQAFKKLIIYIIISTLLSCGLSFIYLYYSELPDSFDNRIRDLFFKTRGEIPNTNKVIIIDIDDKSIKHLGQWPWSRNIIAEIIQNLTNSGIGIIGFDVVFAEKDSSSPHNILKKLNIKRDNIQNYDLILSKVLGQSPVILGYQFELEDNEDISKKEPKVPAIIIEKNKQVGSKYLIQAKGSILNIPILQNTAYSSGFFNNLPDDSGVIRSVPLIIEYNNTIFPSLALEILRVALQSKQIYINYGEEGVQDVKIADFIMPTDRYGRLLVNFRGKEKNFKYISALDIYNKTFERKDIEGKIALVGTSAAGLLDLRATPFESIYPGVEVHANVIDNILAGDYIYKPSYVDAVNIAVIFFLSFFLIFIFIRTPFILYLPLYALSLYITLYTIYRTLFVNGLVINIFFPIITITLSVICGLLYIYFFKIKQEEAIKKKFASKVSKNVMDNLLKNVDSNEFQAMEKEITIFFSDIRGFTNISEKMGDAKKLITYLNNYMEPMSNIITKYEGTIDKYIGDAIMAYWNAPASINNHADKAVQASLEQLASLKQLNKQLEANNEPLIDIGIGLNTGMAVVGEMGSLQRSDYTVIGDAINLGSRLESLCKYYGSKLNISKFTKDKLEDEYVFRYLDLVTVKGKEEAIEIWQVHTSGKASDALQEELDLYHKAIDLYKQASFKEALVVFSNLENTMEKTNDNIYKIYINRCKKLIKNDNKDINIIYSHESK